MRAAGAPRLQVWGVLTGAQALPEHSFAAAEFDAFDQGGEDVPRDLHVTWGDPGAGAVPPAAACPPGPAPWPLPRRDPAPCRAPARPPFPASPRLAAQRRCHRRGLRRRA
jgi:hypothetical protein